MPQFELPTDPVRTQRIRSVLLKAGVSLGGIDQLMRAQPIASQEDRQVIASLIDALLAPADGSVMNFDKGGRMNFDKGGRMNFDKGGRAFEGIKGRSADPLKGRSF